MDIILYAFAIIYTPGPVNITGFLAGLNGYTKQSAIFSLGVCLAMLLTFIILGYMGELFISSKLLPYISLIGGGYIIYLAFHILTSNVAINQSNPKVKLSVWSGFIMQTFNPKNITAVIPITTIMFSASNITGIKILVVSLIISLCGGLAPFAYTLIGTVIHNKITHNRYFDLFNKIMGTLLLISAIFMLYEFYIYVVN